MTVLVARVARPGQPARLERLRIEDGTVVEAGPAPGDADRDATVAGVVLPGFVDGHVHGALGHDLGSCTAEEARAVARHHHEAGATDLVGTLATAPLPALEAQLHRLAPLVEEGVLAGLHLEGPFLAAERRGCHAPELLLRPDPDAVRRLVDAARGTLRTITIAPEPEGGLAAIRALAARGVRAQIGHTACSAELAVAALDAGAVGFTHLFNGMPPVSGREPGPVAAALADDRALVEVIADGVHLADATVDLVRHVARGRVALVSDAMSATGQGDGPHAIAGSAVVVRDGVARAGNGSLAGSTSSLGAVVARLAGRGVADEELAELSSGAAARSLGLSRRLVPGDPADLVVLAPGADGARRVTAVMRRGRWLTGDPLHTA